jgi:hypothetical protein
MTCQLQTTTVQIKESSYEQHRKIPTLQEVARKVARLEKMELD